MKSCPACASAASPGSMKCRQCGALLVAPPSAPPKPTPVHQPVAVGTADAPLSPAPANPIDDRFFAPAVLHPVLVHEPVRARREHRVPASAIVLVALLLVLGIGGVAVAKSMGEVAKQSAETATGVLGDAVKLEVESNRHLALVAMAQAGAGTDSRAVDVATLASVEPGLQWVPATEVSTGPKVVSVSYTDGVGIIAIRARTKGVCAFGRTGVAAVNEYVTLTGVDSCRAADAPAAGWQELQTIG